MTEPWPYPAATLTIPRTQDEAPGKPRRVHVYSNGDAECACRRNPADRRRSRVYPYGVEGCHHAEAARAWISEPCRVVVDELLADWYTVGWHHAERADWWAHACRRLQEAQEAERARVSGLAERHRLGAMTDDEVVAEALATFG